MKDSTAEQSKNGTAKPAKLVCRNCGAEWDSEDKRAKKEYRKADDGTVRCRDARSCRSRKLAIDLGIDLFARYPRELLITLMDRRPPNWKEAKWRSIFWDRPEIRVGAAIIYFSWCFPVSMPYACQTFTKEDGDEDILRDRYGMPMRQTQRTLADFLTIQEHLGTIAGLRLVFIGDANNVARSLARAAILAGSQLVLACPKNYAFTQADITAFGAAWGKQVIQVHDPAEAVSGAHVLYTDVWTSMGQEAEKAERIQAFCGYQINDALIAKARGDVRIMHCLPAHRDEEITDSAVEHQRSIIFDQAENRMHAQKAILRLLMANDSAAVIAAART